MEYPAHDLLTVLSGRATPKVDVAPATKDLSAQMVLVMPEGLPVEPLMEKWVGDLRDAGNNSSCVFDERGFVFVLSHDNVQINVYRIIPPAKEGEKESVTTALKIDLLPPLPQDEHERAQMMPNFQTLAVISTTNTSLSLLVFGSGEPSLRQRRCLLVEFNITAAKSGVLPSVSLASVHELDATSLFANLKDEQLAGGPLDISGATIHDDSFIFALRGDGLTTRNHLVVMDLASFSDQVRTGVLTPAPIRHVIPVLLPALHGEFLAITDIAVDEFDLYFVACAHERPPHKVGLDLFFGSGNQHRTPGVCVGSVLGKFREKSFNVSWALMLEPLEVCVTGLTFRPKTFSSTALFLAHCKNENHHDEMTSLWSLDRVVFDQVAVAQFTHDERKLPSRMNENKSDPWFDMCCGWVV